MQENIKLYQKISKVMGELPRIPKAGTNDNFHYAFATNDDVVDTIRVKLAEHGLAFFASMTDYRAEDSGTKTKTGAPIMHTVVRMEFTLADSESGGVFTSMWFGECLESGDKGINKAATSAEKYFLLKTFMLSTGDSKDDPDAKDVEVDGDKGVEPAKPKFNGNSPFSKPAPAPGQFAENETSVERVGVCGQVKVKQTANGKIYYSAILTDDGKDLAASAWERKPFQLAGVDTSEWKDDVDKTFYFPDILVYYSKNDKGYNQVERCESAKERV